MPKAVDIYVLDQKIGAGQFGDVYKGYSKVDGTDVAIKTIRRDKVKGKFTQLLDNEIQVLKSCRNNNIIRLIDIKKTANNIYLVLEFCNEGDLGAYLKQKKRLPQQQAVEYFVQILHAFQTLVQNKIMHRDFKLPNVLKHNGVVKVADFGFSKLLGEEDEQAETILGSPLNMAPQILDHQAYNNKADIWSIGVAFYQMVFGKVPFTASNIIDLLKKIKKEPVTFPRPVHPLIQDVLKKMLVVDVKKRISWNQLFTHPITRMLEEQIEENLKQSMLCKKDQMGFNISKFYIKNNRVIENTHELFSKEDLNRYVKNIIDNKEVNNYEGPLIKRKNQREDKLNYETKASQDSALSTKQSQRRQITKTEKYIANQVEKQEENKQKQLLANSRSIKEKNVKKATQLILFQRNRYAFFGHLAEELLQLNLNMYAYCLSFLLVKKVVENIGILVSNIKKRNISKIETWQLFEQSLQYERIINFIKQEEEIFNKFYEKLALKVLQQGTLSHFEQEMMISGKFTREQTNRRILINVMRQYFKIVQKSQNDWSEERKLKAYQHLLKLMDVQERKWKNDEKFDFNAYYSDFKQLDTKNGEQQFQKALKQWRQSVTN